MESEFFDDAWTREIEKQPKQCREFLRNLPYEEASRASMALASLLRGKSAEDVNELLFTRERSSGSTIVGQWVGLAGYVGSEFDHLFDVALENGLDLARVRQVTSVNVGDVRFQTTELGERLLFSRLCTETQIENETKVLIILLAHGAPVDDAAVQVLLMLKLDLARRWFELLNQHTTWSASRLVSLGDCVNVKADTLAYFTALAAHEVVMHPNEAGPRPL